MADRSVKCSECDEPHTQYCPLDGKRYCKIHGDIVKWDLQAEYAATRRYRRTLTT